MTPFGVPIVHWCETDHAMFEDRVTHVVLPPRVPFSTPFTDLRDAGYSVLGVGLLPSEVPECPVSGDYGQCEHVLLR